VDMWWDVIPAIDAYFYSIYHLYYRHILLLFKTG
jgi:hypothetical protein